MTTAEVLNKLLATIDRYDAEIGVGGCECCGSRVEYNYFMTGEVVKYDELAALVKQLINETKS